MNIFISHIHLNIPHGSETWTSVVCAELIRRGHNVYIWSPKVNKQYFNEYFKDCILVTGDNIYDIKIDFAILQHIVDLQKYKQKWKSIIQILPKSENIVFMCHSILYNATAPVRKPYLDKSRYFCVSPEVAKKYHTFDWTIINQPIEDAWFKSTIISKNLKTILYASHRHKVSSELVQLCDNKNINIEYVGSELLYPPDIRKIYNRANLVIGTGRWIYESMAASIPCIVADNKFTLGYVTLDNIKSLEFNNMTLRHNKRFKPDWNKLLNQYNPRLGIKLHNYAKKNYHVSVIVDQMLN